MPMSESALQMTLAADADFLRRLAYLMTQAARVVKEEALSTPQHTARSNYATSVINNPTGAAQQAAVMIVGGTNLIGTTTLEDTGPETSATDGAILSQIATFWNALAGVDSGAA